MKRGTAVAVWHFKIPTSLHHSNANDHTWFSARVGISWAFQQPHPNYIKVFVALSGQWWEESLVYFGLESEFSGTSIVPLQSDFLWWFFRLLKLHPLYPCLFQLFLSSRSSLPTLPWLCYSPAHTYSTSSASGWQFLGLFLADLQAVSLVFWSHTQCFHSYYRCNLWRVLSRSFVLIFLRLLSQDFSVN